MSDFTLTHTRLAEGIWEGVLSTQSGRADPKIEVIFDGQALKEGVSLEAAAHAGEWALRFKIPEEAIATGAQVFLIRDEGTEEILEAFALMAGTVPGDSVQSEVALLRAELDMLKRAFRRMCTEQRS